VIARADGITAVDARIRITSHALADPFLWQLPAPRGGQPSPWRGRGGFEDARKRLPWGLSRNGVSAPDGLPCRAAPVAAGCWGGEAEGPAGSGRRGWPPSGGVDLQEVADSVLEGPFTAGAGLATQGEPAEPEVVLDVAEASFGERAASLVGGRPSDPVRDLTSSWKPRLCSIFLRAGEVLACRGNGDGVYAQVAQVARRRAARSRGRR
jgi:hypothetical protein